MDGSSAASQRTTSTTTAHGLTTYLPLPKEQRRGIALCLSGGGYRAALFHLGALSRLNELGILAQVDTITSVSGGSVFAAMLGNYLTQHGDGNWPPDNGVLDGWEAGVATPLRDLAQRNIRTPAVLSRYHPRNLIGGRFSTEVLSDRYARFVSGLAWNSLPERPRFVMCATDMEFGSQWVFDSGKRHAGSRAAGFAAPVPEEWTVARAVAASSALPGAFVPIRLTGDPHAYANGNYRGEDRAARISRILLTDGGMYDNLGLEPVWRDHRIVLVSDGGPTFASWQSDTLLWRGMQHAVILLDQATDVRKRWLISNFLKKELGGTYWGTGSLPRNYEYDGDHRVYPEQLIKNGIDRIRIDFDAFSEGEIGVLENHGYLMTEIAVRRHTPELVRTNAPVDPPHEEWLDEKRANQAVRRSDRVSFLGRGRPV
jgi:NTE family protein